MHAEQRGLSDEVLRAFDLWPYKHKEGKRGLSGQSAPEKVSLHICWLKRTVEVARKEKTTPFGVRAKYYTGLPRWRLLPELRLVPKSGFIPGPAPSFPSWAR
jgi:hypothetical protein